MTVSDMRVPTLCIMLLFPLMSSASVCTEYLASIERLITFLEKHESFLTFSKESSIYTRLEKTVRKNRSSAIHEFNESASPVAPFLRRSLDTAKSTWDATKSALGLTLPAYEIELELLGIQASLTIASLGQEIDLEEIKLTNRMASETINALADSVFLANSKARISFETLMFFSACEQG